jgi:hypothetical protein
VQPNNFQWEGVAGQDGVHGHKRVPVIPMVETNVSDDCPLSSRRLWMKWSPSTWMTGKPTSISRRGIPAQLDTGEGQIDVKFEALTAKDLCICGTPCPLEEMRARATGLAAAVCYAVGTDTEGVTPPCPRA